MKPLVFSGVQPTGNLHLGNYLGAIVNFVALQESHDCIYCVVDMHAITQGFDVWGGPKVLTGAIREVAAAYIAAGVDPKKSIIFNQSQVPGHAELAWVFNTVARLGWRTQFAFARYAAWAAESGAELRERRPLPPLGHFSLIRFAKPAR